MTSEPSQTHPEAHAVPQAASSFLLLLAGPPGTGKSSFALELCYNLARFDQPASSGSLLVGKRLRSLYISSELPSNRIIENAISFGWDDQRQYFWPYKEPGGARRRPRDTGCCVVCGTEILRADYLAGVKQQRSEKDLRDPEPFFDAVNKVWMETLGGDLSVGDTSALKREGKDILPQVVVIDSLNILDRSAIAKRFLDIRYSFGDNKGKHPLLLVVIVDGPTGSESNAIWEFLADAVFRFEGEIGWDGYYQRSFQIMKIKTQSHAWGRHVFKIQDQGRTRHTPYRETGGTFIFPTVHWHLSRSIRTESDANVANADNNPVYETPFFTLNALLGVGDGEGSLTAIRGGFPAKQTTALVGRRGGMKSHLAYHFLLSHALGDQVAPKNVLLVSLRDDLNAAKATLRSILRQQMPERIQGAGLDSIQKLLDDDRMEIIYNWPGCISPGEFFHRIFVALNRPRRTGTPGGDTLSPTRSTAEIVILNGLEHLEAKFPLCAHEKVFVPALISLFRCYGVCSVIIATEEAEGAASAEIGPMADLILDFSAAEPGDLREASVPGTVCQSAKVTTVRVPAGRIGGLWGIFGRSKIGRMEFFPQPFVREISDSFPQI